MLPVTSAFEAEGLEIGFEISQDAQSLEQLRAEPAGIRVPLTTRHRTYAELEGDTPRGFRTPSRKIELYSEVLTEHGYLPLPETRNRARAPDRAPSSPGDSR